MNNRRGNEMRIEHDGADEFSRYVLQTWAPASRRWYQSGPAATDPALLRQELAAARRVASPLRLRIVGPDGVVIEEYRP